MPPLCIQRNFLGHFIGIRFPRVQTLRLPIPAKENVPFLLHIRRIGKVRQCQQRSLLVTNRRHYVIVGVHQIAVEAVQVVIEVYPNAFYPQRMQNNRGIPHPVYIAFIVGLAPVRPSAENIVAVRIGHSLDRKTFPGGALAAFNTTAHTFTEVIGVRIGSAPHRGKCHIAFDLSVCLAGTIGNRAVRPTVKQETVRNRPDLRERVLFVPLNIHTLRHPGFHTAVCKRDAIPDCPPCRQRQRLCYGQRKIIQLSADCIPAVKPATLDKRILYAFDRLSHRDGHDNILAGVVIAIKRNLHGFGRIRRFGVLRHSRCLLF